MRGKLSMEVMGFSLLVRPSRDKAHDALKELYPLF